MHRPDARPGRGAPENRTPDRFNLPTREADGDWLDAREEQDGGPPPLRTTVTVEHPKTIISRNSSPDIGFDRSINPYRGCEHGCIYCFARPTHAFHDLSPGLDFESRLFAKPDAAKLLRAELGEEGLYRPPDGARHQHRSLSADRGQMADHPLDPRSARRDASTRFTITTKSDRVLADLDILRRWRPDNLACVALSVTSLTPEISRTLEPRAPAARKRLAAVKALNEAGVPAWVSIAPVVPGITDHELEHIVEAAAEAGAARRASISPSACPSRSRLCSAPGSTSIFPTAPAR